MGKHADNGAVGGPYPYHVGVLAPLGFDPPGLDAAVSRAIWGLLARKRRQGPVSLLAPLGEPVDRAARVAGDRFGWGVGFLGPPAAFPARLDHLRVCVQVASAVDAVVLFGDPTPADMGWVLAVARRLGTAVRAVRVRPDTGRPIAGPSPAN